MINNQEMSYCPSEAYRAMMQKARQIWNFYHDMWEEKQELISALPHLNGLNGNARAEVIMRLMAVKNPNYQQLCPKSRIALHEVRMWLWHLRGFAYTIEDIEQGRRTIRPSEVKAWTLKNPRMCSSKESPLSDPVPIRVQRVKE